MGLASIKYPPEGPVQLQDLCFGPVEEREMVSVNGNDP